MAKQETSLRGKMETLVLDEQIQHFLAEDLEHGDVTTDAIFRDEKGLVQAIARQPLVACGMKRGAARVFCLLGGPVEFGELAPDGARIEAGRVLFTARGPVATLLKGERVALNLIQRLCGIATLTADFVRRVEGLATRIVDTRKTTPGLRMLEKYAVRCGGGRNHRFSLSDGVLIKDNHIAACGSLTEAVERTRSRVPHTLCIEVECDTLEQVREALAAGADIIMLDNMEIATLRKGVELIGNAAISEASGGITLDNVRAVAETGVDIISIGALTHSAPAVDIGLDWIS
jgi:nicotinate-nucleotide pyrophosphorylase (carboxylating)